MLTLGLVSAAVSSGFYARHEVIIYLPYKGFDQNTAKGPLSIEVILTHESYILVRRLTQWARRSSGVTEPSHMPTYIGRFTLQLQWPIATAEISLPELRGGKASDGYLREIVVRVSPAEGIVRDLAVEVTYSGENLVHFTLPDKSTEDGIWVGSLGGEHIGLFVPPWEAVHDFICPVLYHLSGFTLQPHIYWDIDENLAKWVSDFHWVMPDGRTVPSIPPHYPGRVLRHLRNSGEQLLTLEEWRKLQEARDGCGSGAPLWRLILADAHHERGHDLQKVV